MNRRVREQHDEHVGSNDTNDDETTVSGVTNPSFFPEDKAMQRNTIRGKSTTVRLSKSGDESYVNANSPVFTSGRVSGRIAPSPRDRLATLPAFNDDDFSDPFFPNETEDVTKEESGVSEAPDPEQNAIIIPLPVCWK
jgi:hypothetical protein